MALPLDETITEGQAAHIADHETIAVFLNQIVNDPMQHGIDHNQVLLVGFTTSGLSGSTQGSANWTVYSKWQAAGYPIDTVRAYCFVSSGNVCFATYSHSGSGKTRVPNARTATSGSIACPSVGAADVALGATVTPTINGFAACAADNTTASFGRINATVTTTTTMSEWNGFIHVESAYPCPATASPAATSPASTLAPWHVVGVT